MSYNNSLIEYVTNLSTENWIELTIPEGNWNAIKYYNKTFFLLENNSNRFAYSMNGFDWIVDNFYLLDSDGNENPDGAFINKTNAGFCTKGRGRAITFFKINS
mgnify:CR=1 FL=1